MNNDKKLAIALYTINKEAKVFRDKSNIFREHIRNAVFQGCLDFTEEEKEILLKEYDINVSFLEYEGNSYFHESINSQNCNSKSDIEESIYDIYPELYEFFDQFDINFLQYLGFCEVDVDGLNEDAHQKGMQEIPEGIRSMIGEVNDWLAEEEQYTVKTQNYINKLHLILKETDIFTKIKQNLYLIKSLCLEHMCIDPVAYHRPLNSDSFILEMYDIDGFQFHLPVPEEVVDEDKIDNWNTAPISAENKLDEVDKLTIHEALEILLRNLDIMDLVDSILSGEDLKNTINDKGLMLRYPDLQMRFSKYYEFEEDFDENEII